MSSPEAIVNASLPFLDPQQAAVVLLWLKRNNVCDVDAPLKQLLTAYPIEWAYEELKWPLQDFPMELSYMDKKKEEGPWGVLLKATLALRGDAPDTLFDFDSLPAKIVELFKSLEGTSSISAAGIRTNEEVMHKCAWLLHSVFWVLLRYYIPYVKGHGNEGPWLEVVEALFSDKALQTVSLLCPHLARYYVVLILPDRKRTEHVWLIISLITSIKHKLSDPYVRFALDIFNDTNLANAQRELEHMATVADDFMLSNKDLWLNVIRNARLLVFEHYCRIHRSLSLDSIRQLAIGDDLEDLSEEKWIVDLIKGAKIDAKIDMENQMIHMNTAMVNPYAAIVDKSKNTFYKTNMVIKSIR